MTVLLTEREVSQMYFLNKEVACLFVQEFGEPVLNQALRNLPSPRSLLGIFRECKRIRDGLDSV